MAIEWRHLEVGMALALAVLAYPAMAQSFNESDTFATSAPIGRGPLDGMSFVGKIGPEDKRDLDDELHFATGQFWSSNCLACGYQPGAYWTRRVGDSIQFQGSLPSADGGQFDYSGRVVGDHINVQINWTQQRWYGDVKRKLAFVGVLTPAATPQGVPAFPVGKNSEEGTQCRRL